MPIDRGRRPISGRQLTSLTRQLLEASTLCAISTVSPGGRAHIHTAYFAWTSELELVWMSEPRAAHSRNIRASPSVAIAVFDSRQTWGEADRGIQLFGTAREVTASGPSAAARAYARRFAAFAPGDFETYRHYRFRSNRVKLFDERLLGPATFVVARVGRGGRLTWQRTEIYRRNS